MSYLVTSLSLVDADSNEHTGTQQQHSTDSQQTILHYLTHIEHVQHFSLQFVSRLFTNHSVLHENTQKTCSVACSAEDTICSCPLHVMT